MLKVCKCTKYLQNISYLSFQVVINAANPNHEVSIHSAGEICHIDVIYFAHACASFNDITNVCACSCTERWGGNCLLCLIASYDPECKSSWCRQETIIMKSDMLWCPSDHNQELSETFAPWYTACGYLKLINLPFPPPLLHPCFPSLLSPFSLIPYLPFFPKIPVAHHKVFQCYGPLVEDGYGVGFVPQDDQILFGISSFHHAQHPDTGSKHYIQKIRECMMEIHNIMATTRRLTSKLWFQWHSYSSVVIVTVSIVTSASLLSIIK